MSRPTHEAIPLGIFSVIITAENLLACAVLFRHKMLLRGFINRFVVSLALADLLYGVVLLPMTIHSPENSIAPYLTTFILLVNVSNVLAITLDRYLAVTKPVDYMTLMKRHFVKIIVAVWVWPIILCFLPLAWKADRSHIVHTIYILSILSIGIIIPYVIIVAAYVSIFRTVRFYTRNLARTEATERDPEVVQKGKLVTVEARIAWLFAIVATIFIISWMPVIFMSAAVALGLKASRIPSVLSIVSWYTLSLGFLLQPLIYAFMKADIKTALKGMCCPGQQSNRQAASQEMTTIHTL